MQPITAHDDSDDDSPAPSLHSDSDDDLPPPSRDHGWLGHAAVKPSKPQEPSKAQESLYKFFSEAAAVKPWKSAAADDIAATTKPNAMTPADARAPEEALG